MTTIEVPDPELWGKEELAWRGILNAAKFVMEGVFIEQGVTVKEWREFRWDVPDVAASWDLPQGVEANLHVWVLGEKPEYTLYTEGHKWQDENDRRRFRHFPGQQLSVQFEWVPTTVHQPDLRNTSLHNTLTDLVKKILATDLADSEWHRLPSGS